MEEGPVEVKQVSEREIQIGENSLYLDEGNIIHLTSVGEKDEKIATAVKDAYIKIANMVEGKVNLLLDANKSGQPSSEARRIFREGILEYEKTGKVAVFGMNPVARVIASFIMGVSRKKDMRLLKTKEEALTWLKK
jgi:hypothetical protein